MTQNRQSQGNSRLSDREWNENSNRNFDQDNRGQYGNNDEDFQRNTQSGSSRRGQSMGSSNYREFDSNSYGRNDYNSPARDWDNDQFRSSSYGSQQGYRNNRGYQERGLDEDMQRGNRGGHEPSQQGGNYSQQYGNHQGMNYGLGGSQGRNMNENTSYGSTYGTGTNYGSGMGSSNWGNTNPGNSNPGSSSNWDNSNNNTTGQHRGKGPKGYQRSDDRIKEEINDRLTDDGHIDASEIEVEVDNGVVSLSGSVDNRETKRRAEDLAESISGVSNVENRLSVNKENTSDRKNTAMGSSTTANNGASEVKHKRNSALAGAHN